MQFLLTASEIPSLELASLQSNKTDNLFAIRRIVENCRLAGLNEKELRWFIRGLRAFQHSIYQLDLYGESSWEIEDIKLNAIWEEIYNNLSFFGIDRWGSYELVRDIKKYQEIELSLRKGNTPLGLDILDFYYLKTCDVRLARTLVYMFGKHTSANTRIIDLWNCYDIISEVYDDMLDVGEDSKTYNCNRLLIERNEYGFYRVYESYGQIISEVKKHSAKIIEDGSDNLKELCQIYTWVIDRVMDVESVLQSLLLEYASRNNIHHLDEINEMPPNYQQGSLILSL